MIEATLNFLFDNISVLGKPGCSLIVLILLGCLIYALVKIFVV